MSANPMSKKNYAFLIVALLVGIAAGVAIGSFAAGKQGPAKGGAASSDAATASSEPAGKSVVEALGRLRPGNGVVRLGGPSQLAVVVGKLLVEEGDRVHRGQVIAILDNHESQKATVERLRANIEAQLATIARGEAELRTAQNDYARFSRLYSEGTVSASQRDAARLRADSSEAELQRARAGLNLARADLRRAQAELEMTVVRAPLDGQVIKIHARAGEKVGSDGILELADNENMYAVAEVYETDISKIQLGQRATITTPVLDHPLTGVVDRVGYKIGKMDVLGTDPAAKTDARVVEVDVRLDQSSLVKSATNLQVTVSIDVSKKAAATAAENVSAPDRSLQR